MKFQLFRFVNSFCWSSERRLVYEIRKQLRVLDRSWRRQLQMSQNYCVATVADKAAFCR